eukprot:14320010-Ditylum_brightwellii.AAC.1
MAKSCWWLVWWNWEDGKARLAITEELDTEIYLTNGMWPERYLLKQKNLDDSIRQLGLLNNPLGELNNDHDKHFPTCKQVSFCISKNFITPNNTWRIYQNVLLPVDQYPLTMTSWSRNQYHKLSSPFINAILPKLGLNRNFP